MNLKKKLDSKTKLFFFLSLSALNIFLIPPQALAELGDSYVLCKNNKAVRSLRIETKSDNSCKAIYTKQGLDQVIGASQMGGSCDEYIQTVKKTLETANWNCRDVKESRLSNLSAEESR